MKLFLKILVSSLAVFFAAYILPGVYLKGFPSAIFVAIVMGLLNAFLKPLLIILTIPVTFFSFGLFLFVINALIILLTDNLLEGFSVDGFWTALFFSIIVTITTAFLEALAENKSDKKAN
ncbi:MAG: phage holin family protein [Bacteroidales bacterium]|nr:phage holin family protein [Bacteroidales bacterium]